MTIEQLLSPVVMDWIENNDHLSDEQFEKWLVENEDIINESVKTNIDEINECIQKGYENSKLLLENVDDDIDWDNIDFSDIVGSDTTSDEQIITGEVEGEGEGEGNKDIDEPTTTISKKIVLSNLMDNPKRNLYIAINAAYNRTVKRNTIHDKNSKLWGRFDMSKIEDTTALLAFTDMRNADLSSWVMSKVKTMEGMFYKSTFNNESICKWDVSNCTNFLRMFTFSDFNQSLKKWKPGYIDKTEYDEDGIEHTVRVRANLPLIGAAADEEAEMLNRYWDDQFNKFEKEDEEIEKAEKIKENKTLKPMKHILDYETFVNEGFKDFIKKGFDKVKSFFKNITVKLGNFVAMFDSNGEIIDASNPYTALNYISDGKVKGVTAFTGVKNEYINDNVKPIADIIESPEYYGIVDKNSIEYKNYITMVEMVNEHYSKYGEILNEDANNISPRVGFSGKYGGLKDIRDINSKTLISKLTDAINNAPAYKGKDYSGAILIWGAPGIGKSTIPNAVIKAWNDNPDNINKQKALMVVECGDLTVDGFSLPLPMKKTIGQYLKERPKAAEKLGDIEKELQDIEIKVSGEAVKTWLPVYKLSTNRELNKIGNEIANGFLVTEEVKNEETGEFEDITTETTEGGILLFDEFFRANPQVFKILMQILLNRKFNTDYKLGNKWAILACSNRPEDDKEVGEGFEETGAVVGTRFSKQYNFIPDFDEWKIWAIDKGHFDDATITFLMQEVDTKTGEYTNWHTVKPLEYSAGKTAWPTPRTWSKLMVELHNIMINNEYSSIQEIPLDIIEEEAAGAIGEDMAQKYVQFLKTFKSDFTPSEVLDNTNYSIPTDMKCSEVIHRLKKHIDLEFSKDKLPSDEQMENMFNTIENTYNPSKDNYVRPLYISIFNKFDFFENPIKFAKEDFPNFTKLIMKKYGLKSSKELKDFLV